MSASLLCSATAKMGTLGPFQTFAQLMIVYLVIGSSLYFHFHLSMLSGFMKCTKRLSLSFQTFSFQLGLLSFASGFTCDVPENINIIITLALELVEETGDRMLKLVVVHNYQMGSQNEKTLLAQVSSVVLVKLCDYRCVLIMSARKNNLSYEFG